MNYTRPITKISQGKVFCLYSKHLYLGQFVYFGPPHKPKLVYGKVISQSQYLAEILILSREISPSLDWIITIPHQSIFDVSIDSKLPHGIYNPLFSQKYIFNISERFTISSSIINPIFRKPPNQVIPTGLFFIDFLNPILYGQKLAFFIKSPEHSLDLLYSMMIQFLSQSIDNEIVIAATGISEFSFVSLYDIIDPKKFQYSDRVSLVYSSDYDSPILQVKTPESALSFAEYCAFKKSKNVLVILYNFEKFFYSYREQKLQEGESLARYYSPVSLFSALASIYERCGILSNKKGSITVLPFILGDFIDSHPMVTLTGFITEGQIFSNTRSSRFGFSLSKSLSRMVSHGVGKGKTVDNHIELISQIFYSYSEAQKVKELLNIMNEDELNQSQKDLLLFLEDFELLISKTNLSFESQLNNCYQLLARLSNNQLLLLSQYSLDQLVHYR